MYAIHYNPEYFPDPERYDPYRFMDPETSKHLPLLTFGDGPRNCIGMRFAYIEIKLCLASIIRDFEFVKAPTTPKELKIQKVGVATSLPFELSINKRQK